MASRPRLTGGRLLVVCIALTSALLSACGTTANGGGNASSCQLAFWTGLTGPDGPQMQQIIAQFNAAHPSSKVTMTISNALPTKLGTAAASDTLPDLALVNEDQIATQAYRGVLAPMDSIAQQTGYTSSDFPQAAYNQANLSGHLYGLPLSFVSLTMYYNADLFQKANISGPPTNDADFQADAAKLTSGKQHGFQITSGFPVEQIFQMLLHQFGGSEFNSDYSQATWNSPAGVQALTWMRNAQAKYSQPKLEVDADLNSFKLGNVGMIWNGIWQTGNVTGDGVSFKGVAAAPPQIGSQPAIWAGAAYLTTPHHKTARSSCQTNGEATFIKYLLDNAPTWAKAGNVPAPNKARHSAEVQALTPQNVLATALDTPAMAAPPIPGASDDLAPLGSAVSAVMAGTQPDIQKALDDAATQANQVIQQNRQKYGSAPPAA